MCFPYCPVSFSKAGAGAGTETEVEAGAVAALAPAASTGATVVSGFTGAGAESETISCCGAVCSYSIFSTPIFLAIFLLSGLII